ncbi:dCTP pyrophosphatase 1 [Tiliqua scincoides]|uniref:dCTP pyrophosphatase 1 n=1 Tax=Tiliqua scincoides TaxID=71010 RepID=UPI003462E576
MSLTKEDKYGDTYCKDWEEQKDLKDWLRPVAGDEGKAACRFCECEILARNSELQQHMATTKHKKSVPPGASMSLTDAGLNVPKSSGSSTTRIKLLTDGALNSLASASKTIEGQPDEVTMGSEHRNMEETFHFSTEPTLEDIRNLQCAFAAERGWGKYHQPRNLLLALVGEVGELAELFQWREEVPEGLPGWTASEREALSDELSDVLIYLVALADKCHVDLPSAALRKMEKNCLKYPAKQVYGSSKKYTEYQK